MSARGVIMVKVVARCMCALFQTPQNRKQNRRGGGLPTSPNPLSYLTKAFTLLLTLLLLSSLQYETAFARQTPPALSLLSSVSSTSVSSNTKYTRVSNTNTQEVCVTTNTNVSLLIDPVTSSTKQTLSCTPSLLPQPQTHIYVPYTDTSSYLYVPYITNTHISLYYTDKKADPSSFLTFPHTDIATPYGDEKVISITKTTTNLIALLTTRNIFFFDIHVTEKPKITVPIHKQIDNTYLSDIPSLRNSRYTFSLTHPNKDITIDRYTGQIHLSSLPTSPITAIAINRDTTTHITYAIDTHNPTTSHRSKRAATIRSPRRHLWQHNRWPKRSCRRTLKLHPGLQYYTISI
ncbi:unknown [Tropheryma whipplei str. Twist]|uniref:WisP N-terminal domain-containing protein n=1 Tax=Tropheryma whipplei (strain Twist) TaxID=203267 RepID=Q83FU0_TROWT|nr:unknown [Tropheryma whipplei str. Twist]